MGRIRDNGLINEWRCHGIELTADDLRTIDAFLDTWFSRYNQPGVLAYRSAEALNAVHDGVLRILGNKPTSKQQRNASSVARAGYSVAATEFDLSYRSKPDRHLVRLFTLMDHDHPGTQTEASAIAHRRGRDLGEVAYRMLDDPCLAKELRGFGHREAVFVELRRTLFLKLKIMSLGSGFNSDEAEHAMRLGHVVGVCEEALPTTTSLKA